MQAFNCRGGRPVIRWALDTALCLLGDSDPQRWAHTLGVVDRAKEVCAVFEGREGAILVASAYLNDVGYAPALRRTGAHQLDGALALQTCGEHRLAALVAPHSEAVLELELRGFGTELHGYAKEVSPVSDALTYCDLTTGPTGERVGALDRMGEVQRRYGEGVIVDALRAARPALLSAAS